MGLENLKSVFTEGFQGRPLLDKEDKEGKSSFENMVEKEYNDAVSKGRSRLFENITTSKLSSSIKDHFAPKMKEFEIIESDEDDGLLRKIHNKTD